MKPNNANWTESTSKLSGIVNAKDPSVCDSVKAPLGMEPMLTYSSGSPVVASTTRPSTRRWAKSANGRRARRTVVQARIAPQGIIVGTAAWMLQGFLTSDRLIVVEREGPLDTQGQPCEGFPSNVPSDPRIFTA